jgi:hypothetical protein
VILILIIWITIFLNSFVWLIFFLISSFNI